MPRGPIRRGQLIAPLGVGSMVVVRDGTSVICAGLDHWYEREGAADDRERVDPYEFRVQEWRLERALGVDHFRLPPDYRVPFRGQATPNVGLTVPFLRFPLWHACPGCGSLTRLTATLRGREFCRECAGRGRRRSLVQVRFVAMCDHGHLQDFPWREWVHRSAQPACDQPLRLVATGGASLAAQKVVCTCGQSRTLQSVMSADPDGTTTHLSDELTEGGPPYLCRGLKPWLGLTEQGEACARPLRASLRGAANVYYPQTRSAIFLPRGGGAPPAAVAALEQPPLSTVIALMRGADRVPDATALRAIATQPLEQFNDAEVEAAIRVVCDGGATSLPGPSPDEDSETAFRRDEYRALRTARSDEQLAVRPVARSAYGPELPVGISGVSLIPKLRETRVLTGFTRVFPESDQSQEERRAHLWREAAGHEAWLPAYVVHGEGILIEFDEEALRRWEQRPEVAARLRPMQARFHQAREQRHLPQRALGARHVMIHTFAHLLMTRLTFECGYDSASLRERLFVSQREDDPMAGVLIYTAAGDVDGTMGGLVRMGESGRLEPVVRRALAEAEWCSADPVCMETALRGGQGPDSCNLAACHNCALVPETACEEFNRFLDRGLVVGSVDEPALGFFALA